MIMNMQIILMSIHGADIVILVVGFFMVFVALVLLRTSYLANKDQAHQSLPSKSQRSMPVDERMRRYGLSGLGIMLLFWGFVTLLIGVFYILPSEMRDMIRATLSG